MLRSHVDLEHQFTEHGSAAGRSVSNGLVMARLAVACTDEALYARALHAFWYIHCGITDAVEKHKSHPGTDLWFRTPVVCESSQSEIPMPRLSSAMQHSRGLPSCL